MKMIVTIDIRILGPYHTQSHTRIFRPHAHTQLIRYGGGICVHTQN